MGSMTARAREARALRLQWRLEVLGGACLIGTGGQRLRLERKTAGVLALLALEGETNRSKVAGLLWPDGDEERARGNLRQCLHRLKKLAGADLVIGGDHLGLDAGLEVDAVNLESQAFLGDDAGLLTVRGEVLEGLDFEDCTEFADWLGVQRQRVRMARVGAYRRALTQPGTQASDAATGEAWARAWAALEPLSEEAHRALARVLLARGNRAQALTGLRDFTRLLGRELNAAPSADTQALLQHLERDPYGGATLEPSGEAMPRALARPAQLVGREREWATMERAWRESKAIIVSGAPGVGKTRLLEDFLAAHGGGTRFEGRPGDALHPYSTHARTYRQVLEQFRVPLEESVRGELARIIPELGASPRPMASDADKSRFVQAKARVTRQAVALGMTAVAVDDLQFVDPASLEAGYQVYSEHWGRMDGMRTLIAYREGELNHAGVAMLEQAVGAGLAVHVRLEPLSDTAMRALLDALPIPEAVKERSLTFAGGNPLYALEVARDGAEGGVPQRVADLTRERLSKLSKDAQRVAQVAAITGTAFTLELAAAMLETNALDLVAAAAELESAQVMVEERFQHDLVFEAVLGGMGAAVRRLLHRRAATSLEGHADAARMAMHWLEGGLEARAAPWLLRASTEARAHYRLAEAAEFAERAAGAFERTNDPRLAFDALEAAVVDRVAFDLSNHLERLVDRLFALARDDAGRARAFLARVRVLNAWQFAPRAEEAARLGLNRCAPEASLTRADLQAGLGESLWRQERFEAAIEAMTRALADYAALGDEGRRAHAEGRLGIIHGDAEDHAEARRHLEQSVRLLEGLGDEFGAAKSRNMLGITLGRIGLVEDALEQHRLVQDACERIQGAGVLKRMNLANIAQRLFDLDRYSQALEVIDEALRLVQADLTWARAYLQMQRSRLLLRVGALEAAGSLLAEAEAVQNLLPDMRLDAMLLRAQLHRLRGEPAAARALLEDAHAGLSTGTRPFRRIELALERVLTLEGTAALEVGMDALHLARTHGLNGLVVAALTRVAGVQLALGDVDAALEHSREACALLDTYDPPNFYRAEVWSVHTRILERLGDAERATWRARGADWVRGTAEENVPFEHRITFLERNAVNRALLGSAPI
jgi:DNA-binding SARP family transcriptional activator/tetratricopeptide (TPR) repeat protein